MVIVKEEDITNSAWPLARVTELIPGKDGPITKVCPLPLETSPTPDEEIVLKHNPVHRPTLATTGGYTLY